MEYMQVGGDHYRKAGGLQHWDMLAAMGFGWEYYLGAATKYLTRVKDKDLDPAKAKHFVDKLISLIDSKEVPERFYVTKVKNINVTKYLDTYFQANGLDPHSAEATTITLLMLARNRRELVLARSAIDGIIGDATPRYVDQGGPK